MLVFVTCSIFVIRYRRRSIWPMKKYLGKLFDLLDIDIHDLINFFREIRFQT